MGTARSLLGRGRCREGSTWTRSLGHCTGRGGRFPRPPGVTGWGGDKNVAGITRLVFRGGGEMRPLGLALGPVLPPWLLPWGVPGPTPTRPHSAPSWATRQVEPWAPLLPTALPGWAGPARGLRAGALGRWGTHQAWRSGCRAAAGCAPAAGGCAWGWRLPSGARWLRAGTPGEVQRRLGQALGPLLCVPVRTGASPCSSSSAT